MSLVNKVNSFLTESIALTATYDELKSLKQELKFFYENLQKPLRVAVVGCISAGKSTLMNGMMESKLVITGSTETTYAPSWFKYGEQPHINVTLKDGRKVKAKIEDIPFWTMRNEENRELDLVKYVEIINNNPMLKEIELVDTPGLESTHGTDSENALSFLGLSKNSMNEITMEETSRADALVYAFSRNMGENDEEILSAFHGPLLSGASPINAIGVLTKVDQYWSSGYEQPLKGVEGMISNLRTNPMVKNVLYNIVPIIGKVAEEKNYVEEKDIGILRNLAAFDSERIKKILRSYEKFCQKEYEDIPVPTSEREYLWHKFGQYGTYIAICYLKEGREEKELGSFLYECSGVSKLMDIIKQHFGNRSFIIKLRNITSKIKGSCYKILNNKESNVPSITAIIECILNNCEKLEADEHAFYELKILQNYYDGSLQFYDEKEIEELLRILGEHGMNCEARLGAQEGSTIKELAQVALEKAKYWNARANEGLNTSEYEEAARVMARSCEIMYSHLKYLCGYK